MQNMLEAALDYARMGWPIFPLEPNTKTPFERSKGYKDATCDLELIKLWWTNHPDANIGFCPENAGICVVDIDADGKFYYGSEATVITPHGHHLYYAGSLPPTASKISPHVDTRGIGSYVLLPPSVVNAKPYQWHKGPRDAWELSDIPQEIVDKCATTSDRRTAPAEYQEDKPVAIGAFKRYLKRHLIPPEGQGSDDACYRAIARGRDLGISEQRIVEMMLETTGFDDHYLWEKVANVDEYQQNEPGNAIPLSSAEKFSAFASRVDEARSDPSRQTNEWEAKPPRDPKEMPEITYFDEDHMLPNNPQGSIGIMYGRRGEHKTNTILTMLEASNAERIIYCAGEGAYGVERDRIPPRANLSSKLRILPRVPAFNEPEHILSFIEANRKHQPQIVVIDTLATALIGLDENSADAAQHLTDNGAVGAIKRAFNCCVVVIAHTGKDASKGVRGSSAFEANTDFLIFVDSDKPHNAIKVTLQRMREGYDGQSAYYQYENQGVPLPQRITEAEYVRMTAKDTSEPTSPVGLVVRTKLKWLKAVDWASGLEAHDLARVLTEDEVGKRPGETGEPGVADWDTINARWRKSLTNNRHKVWAKSCIEERYQDGGSKATLRWFCPDQPEF